MPRQWTLLASQTQALHGVGQRGSYPLLRPFSRPPFPQTSSMNARFKNIPRQIMNGLTHARQFSHARRFTALRFRVPRITGMRLVVAFIAFSLLGTYVYEPLRDQGIFADIVDSTIFRIIPPKLVKPPDDANDTIYKPMTREKEIRLLILEPGAPGEELKCRLIHAELSWNTRYEALSYHWGDGTVTCPINCSGHTEVIYTNLHDALSDLRLPDRERVLWTDRLCINQSDDKETTSQMKLMGEIYSQASQVLIYLGKMDPSVEGAVEAIRRADLEWRCLGSKDPLRSSYFLWCFLTKDEINCTPIINLLRRPWFQRTWVFQEAVLAKRGQVIIEKQSIPWPVFERSVEYMTAHKKVYKDIPAYQSPDTTISGISLISSARSVLHHKWKVFSPQSWFYHEPQDSLKLLDLILDSRSFLVTRSEDKIFGMLGVTTQDIRSNYLRKDSTFSPGDVFRNFVLWDILENNSLRALGSSSDKAGSQYSSPSWVPDFERLDPQSSLTGTKNQVKFNASASLPKQAWTSDNETVLHVKGKIVDTLHTVGNESPATPDTFAGENAHFYNFEPMSHLGINKHMIEEAKNIWLAATERLAHCRDPFITHVVKRTFPRKPVGKISWAPFLRTLVCNRTLDGKQALRDSILDDVASFVRQTLELDVVPEYLLQRDRSKGIKGLESFISLTKSRRFAATDIGLVGYVPMRAQKGDLVCIFYGSEVPFVVRKEAEGKYSLVGECYIHGIMEGEAIRFETPRHKEEVFSLA